MDALIANLQQIIHWSKPSEFEEFASEFYKVGGFFPNVIGAMDRLHLEIELTEERRFDPSFINYKQFHSLHLEISSVPKNFIFCHRTKTGYWFNYFSGSVTKLFKFCCGEMFQHIHNLRFIHVFAGWPGRSADCSVLKHSPLSQTLPQLIDNNTEYSTYLSHLTKHILTLYKKHSGKCGHCSYIN